jgi:hypothetical protein
MPEGRLAHIGFAKVTTYGTPVAASRFFMFHSESVTSHLQEMIPPQITGFFDEGPSYLGMLEHKGKIKFNVYPQSFGAMMTSYGADSLATTPTFALAAGTAGSLATATIFVRVAAIYGDKVGVVPSPASFIGVLGNMAAEQNVPVTGPTGSVTVTITAPTGGAAPAGYVVWYGTSTGAENLYVVTATTTGTITTLTVGGAVVSSSTIGATGTNVHTYLPRQTAFGTNTVTQPFTFEIHRDVGPTNAYQYFGSAIEKLLMSWGVRAGGGGGGDEAMNAEIDLIAQGFNAIAPSTVSYDALANLFLWNQCKISISESAYTTIADIKVEIDNGIEGKAYIDGTRQIHSIVAKGPRIIMITGTALADYGQWTNYLNRIRTDLNVVFTGPSLGTNGNFQLMMDFPQMQITAYPIVVPNFMEIMVGFTAKAKFDSSIAQTPALFTLTNDVVTQY